jgi:hypothetical protein
MDVPFPGKWVQFEEQQDVRTRLHSPENSQETLPSMQFQRRNLLILIEVKFTHKRFSQKCDSEIGFF